MSGYYAGKVAVITGAAHGLGKALAHELASRGCRLALIDCDETAMYPVDITRLPDLERAAQDIIERYGRVDMLINNAATSISAKFEATERDHFQRLMAVNFTAAVDACSLFMPALRQSRRAHIVNVCSSFAWLGYPGKSAYSSSKAALRAFSESLRSELIDTNVGVTVLYPGPLATGIVLRGISGSRREHDFLQRRGLSPALAARRTCDALSRNPARIVLGFDYRAFDLLCRLSPSLASRLTASLPARLGF